MSMHMVGALFLGAVLGYLTHYLVRRDPDPGIEDLAAIVASLMGGLVMGTLGAPEQVDGYFIGLGVGFFLYWVALAYGHERTPSGDEAEQGVDATRWRSAVRLFPFLRR